MLFMKKILFMKNHRLTIVLNMFQRDSVRNQREHLILLLANVHVRLTPKPEPLTKVCERLFFCFFSNLTEGSYVILFEILAAYYGSELMIICFCFYFI